VSGRAPATFASAVRSAWITLVALPSNVFSAWSTFDSESTIEDWIGVKLKMRRTPVRRQPVSMPKLLSGFEQYRLTMNACAAHWPQEATAFQLDKFPRCGIEIASIEQTNGGRSPRAPEEMPYAG
jgi:hypothetical protein